jgi:hypothetical protein
MSSNSTDAKKKGERERETETETEREIRAGRAAPVIEHLPNETLSLRVADSMHLI